MKHVHIFQGSEDQAGHIKKEPKHSSASKLDGRTRALVELMFDVTMFENAMAAFDIDVKKMPLGNLSQSQVKKGYDVLLELRYVFDLQDRILACLPWESNLMEIWMLSLVPGMAGQS
jgi:hypothetical protein